MKMGAVPKVTPGFAKRELSEGGVTDLIVRPPTLGPFGAADSKAPSAPTVSSGPLLLEYSAK